MVVGGLLGRTRAKTVNTSVRVNRLRRLSLVVGRQSIAPLQEKLPARQPGPTRRTNRLLSADHVTTVVNGLQLRGEN
jgi:hypothetical protein